MGFIPQCFRFLRSYNVMKSKTYNFHSNVVNPMDKVHLEFQQHSGRLFACNESEQCIQYFHIRAETLVQVRRPAAMRDNEEVFLFSRLFVQKDSLCACQAKARDKSLYSLLETVMELSSFMITELVPTRSKLYHA